MGAVIRNVSEQKVNREIEKADFNEQFADGDDAQVIFGLNPNPKISAVAYHVSPRLDTTACAGAGWTQRNTAVHLDQ